MMLKPSQPENKAKKNLNSTSIYKTITEAQKKKEEIFSVVVEEIF